MNKIALSLLAGFAVAGSAFAGHEVSHKDYKQMPEPEPCFRAQELQLDLFGSYTNSIERSDHGDGFGGGLGVNYFFCKYVGIGASGNLYKGEANGAWNFDTSLIARLPIESGSFCIAPYILGGGDLTTDGTTVGGWHAGGGLEWRATHHLGIFAEGRYIWAEDRPAAMSRVGVRFVF